jgi:hypothetical protein
MNVPGVLLMPAGRRTASSCEAELKPSTVRFSTPWFGTNRPTVARNGFLSGWRLKFCPVMIIELAARSGSAPRMTKWLFLSRSSSSSAQAGATSGGASSEARPSQPAASRPAGRWDRRKDGIFMAFDGCVAVCRRSATVSAQGALTCYYPETREWLRENFEDLFRPPVPVAADASGRWRHHSTDGGERLAPGAPGSSGGGGLMRVRRRNGAGGAMDGSSARSPSINRAMRHRAHRPCGESGSGTLPQLRQAAGEVRGMRSSDTTAFLAQRCRRSVRARP